MSDRCKVSALRAECYRMEGVVAHLNSEYYYKTSEQE